MLITVRVSFPDPPNPEYITCRFTENLIHAGVGFGAKIETSIMDTLEPINVSNVQGCVVVIMFAITTLITATNPAHLVSLVVAVGKERTETDELIS